MSSRKRSHSSMEPDIWLKHEAEIRALYQEERKTLKEVKEAMELKSDFPIFPISTYETALRNKLKLHKKFKKRDWQAIYHHMKKRDQQGKGAAVYLYGTKIDPRSIWKEIRRNRVDFMPLGNPQASLREGIIVRTPSPVLPTPIMQPETSLPPLASRTRLSPPLPGPNINTHVGDVSNLQDFANPLTWTMHGGNAYAIQAVVPSQSPTAAVSKPYEPVFDEPFSWDLARTCLEGIPWKALMKGISRNRIVTSEQSSSFHPRIDIPDYFELGQYLPAKPARSSAGQAPVFHELTSNFDGYHFFGRLVYVLSNRIGDFNMKSIVNDIFELLLNRIPRNLIYDWFKIDAPSIRATWETLLNYSWMIWNTSPGYRPAFALILDIGLRKPEWIMPMRKACLGFAASRNLVDVARKILEVGAYLDRNSNAELEDAINDASRLGSIQCLKLLLENYNINGNWPSSRRQMEKRTYYLGRLFTRIMFLLYNHRKQIPVLERVKCLEMVLKLGANIDDRAPKEELHYVDYRMKWYKEWPREWYPTLLELCFYLDEALYQHMLPYSSRSLSEVTRTGVCLAAREGKPMLEKYLKSHDFSRPWDLGNFLKLVLTEQFFRYDKQIDTIVVRTLFELDIEIRPSRTFYNRFLGKRNVSPYSVMVRQLVDKAQSHGFNDDDISVLRHLIQKGAIIDADVLMKGVEREGLGFLPILLQNGADIGRYGGKALFRAIGCGNFETASWLLKQGVDINAEICMIGTTSTIIAHVLKDARLYSLGNGNPQIHDRFSFLVQSGAQLKISRRDSSPIQLLGHVLRNNTNDCLDSIIWLLLDQEPQFEDLSASTTVHLLEECLSDSSGIVTEEVYHKRLDIFKELLKRGAPVQAGSPLAMSIHAGGKHELVSDLLKAGADVNAYSMGPPKMTPLQVAAWRCDKDLVSILLHHRADINLPARGFRGKTALQAACDFSPLSAEEEMAKMEVINFLLSRGADVNAPAADEFDGFTALQITAMYGDLKTAELLLRHGADPNAPSSYRTRQSALDVASGRGRLDMVKFLLNAAALSYDCGGTGFDGSIRLAEESRHFAVAGLIRTHAADNTKLFLEIPFLASIHEAAVSQMTTIRLERWIYESSEESEEEEEVDESLEESEEEEEVESSMTASGEDVTDVTTYVP
ncbi:hypothetical protein F4775DRAFT_581856 [Biscogniauxia sp. FL1348]|nr:hypothetical protein F4775DRAFT_581856 [Biscogniauxia sp. FL1348]